MTDKARSRPLSPHLTIWKWGPHMLVSILHRATGTALATAGAVLLVWWLAAAAGGAESYARFVDLLTTDSGALNIGGYVILIGLTLAVFQHMLSGIRHFVMDVGAGYELKANKLSATLTMAGSVMLTILFWAWLLAGWA